MGANPRPSVTDVVNAEIEADHYQEDDGPEPGAECGRWSNGQLTGSCGKAGTEECDFECPYRGTL